MANTINVTDLQREAINYQPGLRELPFFFLEALLTAWGINFLEVENDDRRTELLRKANLWKPYSASGAITSHGEIAKIREMKLVLELAYLSVKDNITNYRDKKVLNSMNLVGSGYLSKQMHPLEQLIVGQMVRSANEDLVPAIWHAERDLLDQSAMGLFDGFFTKIADYVTAGDISTTEKNMYNTGAIESPDTAGEETTAVMQVIDFIRSQNDFLQEGSMLYMSRGTFRKVFQSLENKQVYKETLAADVLRYINDKCESNISVIHHQSALGTGDMLMLMAPGLLDFGMNTKGDKDFVKIRQPFEDPNLFQFWMEAAFGTRLNSLHPKLFAINDQTMTAPASMTGDY